MLTDAIKALDEAESLINMVETNTTVDPRYMSYRALQHLKQVRGYLEKLGAQEPVVHQHGFAKENATLRTINESLDQQLEEVMRERDERDDVIDKLLDIVLGEDRYEWSSHYGFADAIVEVEERMNAAPVQAQSEPVATFKKVGWVGECIPRSGFVEQPDDSSVWVEAAYYAVTAFTDHPLKEREHIYVSQKD